MTNNDLSEDLSNMDGEEVLPEATEAAYVTITTTANGPTLRASVPAAESRRMLDTTEFICGVVASLISPFVMAKALDVGSPHLPWQARLACIFVAACTPLAYYWMAARKN
jgi:hypothetical protein